MAVADAYDAMSSDRPYREGLSEEKIEKILRNGAGKQWDPQVVEAFLGFATKFAELPKISPRPWRPQCRCDFMSFPPPKVQTRGKKRSRTNLLASLRHSGVSL